jgi:MazG family protein
MEYPEFKRVVNVIKSLRDPKTGCPWDLKQTHQSLLKYLIEESYEFIHATECEDPQKMKDELGDVLLQVLLHAQIASEENHFNIEDVAKNLADKMIHRHPHVFTDKNPNIDVQKVIENWNQLKEKESTHSDYMMKDDYLHMPALMSSYKIGKKSKEVNFDWNHVDDVVAKVQEEWGELVVEINKNDTAKIKEEMGDLLFSIAQLARHLDLDPEETLRAGNKKFLKRFQKVEDLAQERNLDLKETPQDKLEKLWTEVKSLLQKELS